MSSPKCPISHEPSSSQDVPIKPYDTQFLVSYSTTTDTYTVTSLTSGLTYTIHKGMLNCSSFFELAQQSDAIYIKIADRVIGKNNDDEDLPYPSVSIGYEAFGEFIVAWKIRNSKPKEAVKVEETDAIEIDLVAMKKIIDRMPLHTDTMSYQDYDGLAKALLKYYSDIKLTE